MRPSETVTRAVREACRERADEVIEMLGRYGDEAHEREPDRVHLAILSLSQGNADEVERLIEAAKEDYRDVLMWAEMRR